MSKPWNVYALKDPRNGEIRYIGATINPAKRLNAHLRHCRLSSLQRWLLELGDLNQTPVFEVLETGEGDGWGEVERNLIAHHRTQGNSLTNISSGGRGTIGEMFAGRKHTPGHIERRMAHIRGRKQSSEEIAKRSALLTGRTLSNEHRQSIAAGLMGHSPSPETRAAIGAAHKGKTISEAAKLKMRAAKLGKPLSAEHCAKLSVAQRLRRFRNKAAVGK